MKTYKVSMKSVEKMLRKHYGNGCDEALSYLHRTGQVFINGNKYIVSKKDKLIANIGKENYKDLKRSRKKFFKRFVK